MSFVTSKCLKYKSKLQSLNGLALSLTLGNQCSSALINVLQVNKEVNQKIVEEYGFCVLDHHRERIGNFKIEPPGLFRGRGDHPKQGMLKKKIRPEDVIINCSK